MDRLKSLGAAGYFLGITLWLTWPLGARMTTALSGSPDSLLNAWALAWNLHILPRAPLSLFDANIFAPRPDTLAYSEHLFGIVAVVWPVHAITGNLVLTYNVALLLSFVLSGVGMYLLVHELTGDPRAGLVAGTIYLGAPFHFLHLLHLQVLTLQWFPFVFWCLLLYFREPKLRFVVGTVVFSLLQALSCNYYAVYLAFAIVVFGLVLVVAARSLFTRRRAVELGFGALAVFVIALPFLLPYQRNRDRGFYRRYEDVVQFSAVASDYLRPSAFNDAPHLRWLPRQQRSEKALFPGFVALALAVVGVYTGRGGDPARRLMWIFCGALSILAVVLSLGPETASGTALPYRFFYRHVPGFGSIRAPARIFVLALLGGSVLAGFGASRLIAFGRRRAALVAMALVAGALFEFQTGSLARALPEAPTIPAVYAELAKAPSPGAVLELPIHEGEAIIEESLPMFYSTVHWKPLVNGYSGWWPNDYWELVGRLRHFPTSRSLRFLLERAPVRYVVVHYDKIPEPRRRRLEADMERYRERMPVRFRVGDDVVYEIVAGDEAPS